MNEKFEFTGKVKVVLGVTLNQIRAVADFAGVVKGEIGGWIAKEANLQVSGNAWVSGNARVSGNAWVYGDAQVSGNASPEEIMRLDEVREIVLNNPKRLRMSGWHSGNWNPNHTPQEEHACGSAHCIAGWLQALCDDKDMREVNPQFAASTLAPVAAASGIFFVDDDMALEWITERRYAKTAEPQPSQS